MTEQLHIYIDGACSGNPGEAAIGVVLKKDGKTIKEIAKGIGEATNNIAEYSALVYALQEALILHEKKILVYTDSELLAKQLTGQYKIKNKNLQLLFEQVQHLTKGFESLEIKQIPREQNKEADKLATGLLKKKQAKVVAPLFEHSGEESPSSKG